MSLNRRDLMVRGVQGAGLLALSRLPLLGATRTDPTGDASKVLVLLQLSGGHDGLSAVVPFGDDAYGRARQRTRIPAQDVQKIDTYRGLHPELKVLRQAYGEGALAIVEGVGYPEPDRSHFKSLDVWHAADRRGRSVGYGWVGRMADEGIPGADDPNLVIHVGRRPPFALHASRRRAISFSTPQAYRWVGLPQDAKALEEAAPICEHEAAPPTEASRPEEAGRDAALARLRAVLREAWESSEAVRSAVARYEPKAEYPRNARLSRSLATVTALMAGGLGTRVYSVEMGGFDTHNNQRGRHDNLMRQLDGALGAFQADLRAHGLQDRVVVVAFSEFGRRVAENGSAGTDHGAAGPLFVLGAPVKGGLYGKHPSLTELQRGDLVHTTDFRRVYATLIDRWLGGRSASVLRGSYEPLGFLPA